MSLLDSSIKLPVHHPICVACLLLLDAQRQYLNFYVIPNIDFWSNTKVGLEGEIASRDERKSFFPGPILPVAPEKALDGEETPTKKRTLADKTDECIIFFFSRGEKEVVHVALRSHAQLSIAQAVAIIEGIPKHSVLWNLLFLRGKEKIGEHWGTSKLAL